MICLSTHPAAIQRFKTLEHDCNVVHKNKYDYSKAVFVNMLTHIDVVCQEHGTFSVTPAHHVNGKGCKACGSMRAAAKRKSSTADFLAKVKDKHPLLDFSEVIYENAKTKVRVVCPVHELFYMSPNKLLGGQGCPSCKGSRISKQLTKPFSVFLQEAKQTHANKYSYEAPTYVNASTKMAIRCIDHGLFYQTPDAHLRGAGCPKCAVESNKSKLRKTTQQFIENAVKVHGTIYSYSKVNYVSNNTNVLIECKHHGVFLQTPSNHLAGKGCKQCTVKWSATPHPTLLYYVKIITPTGEIYYKVGITKFTVAKRFAYELNHGFSVSVLYSARFLSGYTALDCEQTCLKRFAHLRYKGTSKILHKGAGDTELFTANIL